MADAIHLSASLELQVEASSDELLNAFHVHYYHFLQKVQSLSANSQSWELVTLAQLGDDLDEYVQLVRQVQGLYLYSIHLSHCKPGIQQFFHLKN